MRKKFDVGDLVAPTKRAPKDLVRSAKFYVPKPVRSITHGTVYEDYRSRLIYIVGGNEFLAEELRLVKKAKY